MAKQIVKYVSNNGKEFDTEIKAKIEDAKSKIYKFVDDVDSSNQMTNEEVAEMLIDNVDSFHRLLSELKGLKTLKIINKM